VKLSVLFFYRRIFVVDKDLRNVRNLLFLTMITIVALWATGYTITLIFMCKGRFEILWSDLIAMMDYCMNILKVGYSYAVSDFILDALIIMLPLPFVSETVRYRDCEANARRFGSCAYPSRPSLPSWAYSSSVSSHRPRRLSGCCG
jgi:hypothetical protein